MFGLRLSFQFQLLQLSPFALKSPRLSRLPSELSAEINVFKAVHNTALRILSGLYFIRGIKTL